MIHYNNLLLISLRVLSFLRVLSHKCKIRGRIARGIHEEFLWNQRQILIIISLIQ